MEAIAIDLDSTALSHDGVFSDTLVDVLTKLHKKNIKIFIATGRSLKSLDSKIPKETPIDGYVAASGVVVKAQDTVLYKTAFSKNTAEFIINLARDYHVYYEINTTEDGPFTFAVDKDYSLKDLLSTPETDVYGYEIIGAGRSVNDSRQWVNEVNLEDIIKFYFFSNSRDKISRFYKVLDQHSNNNKRYALYQTAPHNSETMVPGVDKATGLEKLLDYYQITFEDLHVFGDSMNDIPMFKKAKKTIAMKNATPELKSMSDAITKYTCDEDGLAIYLNEHYL